MKLVSRGLPFLLVATLGTGLSGSALGAANQHRIYLNKGIGAVQIGDSKKHVVRELGKPDASCGENCLTYEGTGDAHYLDVLLVNHHVHRMDTTRKADRSDLDVGPGVDWKRLAAHYPACRGQQSCFLGEPKGWFPKKGQRFTYALAFVTRGSKRKTVGRVSIGRYNSKYDECPLVDCEG